ncbi:MAG: zinc-dependent metalloprotease [Pyrinomonadaceae bacterium]
MFHNVVALLEDWYFIQAGASDPRASKLPLSEEVMQELVRYVVAHEVGHSIGLQHNMLGNNAYPVESYRDPNFVKEFGMSSSIMDYARFNYIAQPEDNAIYIPNRVGPYDHFAIEWGYKQFDNTKPISADEAPLNAIAALQLNDARLRFGSGFGGDPRAQTEDIGDDAIKATTYGLKNLERLSGMLISATSQNGKDFSHLNAMYGTLLGQMNRELGHVAAYVGGIERDNLVAGLPRADTFRPTPVAKQKEALSFVIEHGFQTKPFLLNREIIQRIGIDSVVSQISSSQSSLMRRVLNSGVVDRNSSLEAAGYQVYPSVEIFDDVRTGIFAELYGKDKAPDVFRRNLQRATVDHLISAIDKNDAGSNIPAALRALGVQARTSADYRALCRNMLVKLKADLARVSSKSKDEMTRINYTDLSEVITQALAGK